MLMYMLIENSKYYDGDAVDVAVVPSGTVRDTYTKGDITVEAVYNSFSLGIGKRRDLPEYPFDQCVSDGQRIKVGSGIRCFNFGFYDNRKTVLQRVKLYI